ncbi:MAG: DUF2961 domain-containing protein [Bacteroidales bacterium]|nr:DUF2961 domain-containing protein [Bacteroidales bacterium]
MYKRKPKFLNGCIFITVLFFCYSCSNPVTIKSLLKEMSDREQLTYFPEKKYQLKQASSYNRETTAIGERGWYANGDMSYFIRVDSSNNRREFVMFDHDGPGAVVRWWMTFWKAENGILRIYLDNDSIPEIEGHPFDVISGQMLTEAPFSQAVPDEAPLNERGHNLYVPIPFAKHCKITYECDSLREQANNFWPDVFYNICYREYEKETKIETFTIEALQKAKQLFDQTKVILLADFSSEKITETFNQEILPGDSLLLLINEKDAAISYLNVVLKSRNKEQALRSTVLSVAFDGQQTVWVPVGEFFGTGYKMFPHKTWVNKTTKEGNMQSVWVMPFREKCKLAFINYGNDTIRLEGNIGLTDYIWKANSMYFGASWHEYNRVKTRNEKGWFFDVNYIDIEGKGLYVGDQVTLFNMANTWWGEGDEKIFVDGETFPSNIGTGSEDYYGYAFGHPEPFSHPFISQPTGAGNFVPEMTINMRHRSLDAIPFTTSISSNIEMWHWYSTCINYAMTAYWYVQFPYNVNIMPDIENVKQPVIKSKDDFYNPTVDDRGILEGEYMQIVRTTGGNADAAYLRTSEGEDYGQVNWRYGGKGDTAEFRFRIPEKVTCNIWGIFTKAEDYGSVRILINNKKAGIFHGYQSSGITTSKINLGTHVLHGGYNTLTLIMIEGDKRANPANLVGIDKLLFTR